MKSGKCQALHTIPRYLLSKPGAPSPDNLWKDTVTQSYDEWLEKENITHPKAYPFKYGMEYDQWSKPPIKQSNEKYVHIQTSRGDSHKFKQLTYNLMLLFYRRKTFSSSEVMLNREWLVCYLIIFTNIPLLTTVNHV